MRLDPGSVMPVHSHRGHEFTLVLAGGFRDGSQQFLPGDFAVRDASHRHQPIVDDDGQCLCLVVLDAPLRLTGAVGRLLNPFLRI
jgi:putative transcriptional regulator